jgi:phenylpropionate dioxygenase-like ring-hydroxylating dioxygenase large terminal subunit
MSLTETTVFAALRRTWQPVALSRDLSPNTVRGYRLLDVDLVLARFADGRILAADEACPHKGARLTAGCIREETLMCPYHGWSFDSSGACKSIPSLIERNPEKEALAHLRTYSAQDRYGFVWVKLDSAPSGDEPPHDLPPVPEFENPKWTYLLGPPTPFAAGWRREVENYLDMTHFAFAHSTTLGRAADYRIPPLDIRVTDDGGFRMDAPFPALTTPVEPPGKLQSAHHRHQRCWLPNFTIIRQSFGDGDERILLHVPSPNGPESCTVFWSLAISPGFQGPPPSAQLEFAVRVLEEDRLMCENQRPLEVPINPARGGWGVLVMPGDALANIFQRQFRRWLQSNE